jgi:hypothetical protein
MIATWVTEASVATPAPGLASAPAPAQAPGGAAAIAPRSARQLGGSQAR